MKTIGIIGAGISGLTLAYLLKKKFGNSLNIKIFEGNSFPGGCIQTVHDAGFLFELGPRSCRSAGNGRYTLRLIEELSLTEEIISADKSSRKKFIYRDEKLQALPAGIFGALFSPLMKGVPKALLRELFIPKGSGSEETIEQFMVRRFGRYMTDTFIDPMTLGIYAGKIAELSMKACFPLLHTYEQINGSIMKGVFSRKKCDVSSSEFVRKFCKEPIFSFRNGMQTLTDTLAKHLKNELFLKKTADNITFKKEKIIVSFKNHEPEECDSLFAACPGEHLAELLKEDIPNFPSVETASVALACVGYKKQVLPNKGFGHLIPSSEKNPVLGMVWDSSVFPQQNKRPDETRLSVMTGGSLFPGMIDMSEKEIEILAIKAVKEQLNITEIPDSITIYKRKNAIPQYTIGHMDRIKKMEEHVKNLSPHFSFLGWNYYGVSVNDCIAQAYHLTEHQRGI